MSALTIRTMQAHEVSIAIDWAEKEGWRPGINDATCFYTADPKGFFIGCLGNRPVVVGSLVAYDHTYGFGGLYIVTPEERGKGYGMLMTQHLINYAGNRNIGADGVLENVALYQTIGFKPYYQNHRYQFFAKAPASISHNIKSFNPQDWPYLLAYDTQCFPVARARFLRAWVQQPNATVLCYWQKTQLKGFIVRRPCKDCHKIGPLFADNTEIAEQLLTAAQQDIHGQQLLFDIPEYHEGAKAIAQQYGMTHVFSTMRMYTRGKPAIKENNVFGLTSFELG